uniref:PCI domain-containing protein n=1 Tax=Macrostomum lignano TaxID=282301 RepID=A0A1I8F534_9PLAT
MRQQFPGKRPLAPNWIERLLKLRELAFGALRSTVGRTHRHRQRHQQSAPDIATRRFSHEHQHSTIRQRPLTSGTDIVATAIKHRQLTPSIGIDTGTVASGNRHGHRQLHAGSRQRRPSQEQTTARPRAAPDRHHARRPILGRCFAALRQQRELLGVDLIRQAQPEVTPTALADAPTRASVPALDAEGAVAVDRGMRSSLGARVRPPVTPCGCAGWSSDGETSSAAEETRLCFRCACGRRRAQTGSSLPPRCMSAGQAGRVTASAGGHRLRAVHPRHPVFSYKDRVLGLYNAQGLASGEYEALLRVTQASEYVKCVMRKRPKYRAACLLARQILRRHLKNLILNQLDLQPSLASICLTPEVDIDDYFD